MKRKLNFYAGPATLPVEVLQELRDEIVDYQGAGLSMIETSHRSKEYDAVHNETIALVRELFELPSDYHVLFMGGGATLQFGMVPMNFLGRDRHCDFVLSGSWAKKAYSDAKTYGQVNLVYDGSENGFSSLPDPQQLKVSTDASYLHLTSNETIGGIQWARFPETGNVPIVADMSSDIASRHIPVSRFGLIYAGAQKNLGPAGVTLIIISDDMLQRSSDDVPAYLSYKTHAEKNSLYNTPPVFAIYTMNKVLKWVRSQGGLDEMERRNQAKSDAIYDAIAANESFYSSPVDQSVRSRMNVVFRTPTEDLDKTFLAEAEEQGMVGLKGHRSVGGLRASLYNALPLSAAQQLAEFMQSFAKKHG
jgi:phosphoserine aminotransferase